MINTIHLMKRFVRSTPCSGVIRFFYVFLAGLYLATALPSASADWALPFDRDLDFDILSPAPGGAWSLTGRQTLRFENSPDTPRGGSLTFPQRLELRQLRLTLLPVEGQLAPEAMRTLIITEPGRAQYKALFLSDIVRFDSLDTSAPGKRAVQRLTAGRDVLSKGGTITMVRQNGEAILDYNGVEIGRFPEPREPVQVSLQSVAVPMELSEVFVGGSMWPAARPRNFVPLAKANWNDPDHIAVYPPWPIRVAPAAGVNLSQAQAAPAVSEWRIGEEDYRNTEFGSISQESVDFVVGQHTDKEFPHRLTNFKARKTPESVRIHFNLKSAGPYTLRLSLSGAKNLMNIVHVKVDGQLVQKDIYRGSAVHSPFRDAIPLVLDQGPHVVEIQLELGQTTLHRLTHFTAFDSLALVPGHQPVVYERQAGAEQTLSEKLAPADAKRTTGREFHYRITGLPGQELEVTCSFFQPATSVRGAEIFDVEVNGQPWLKDFDVAAEGGSDGLIQRRGRMTPDGGVLDLHFKGTKGKALVNEILVKAGEQTVAYINCGVVPGVFQGFQGVNDITLGRFGDVPNPATYKSERDFFPWASQKWGATFSELGADFFAGHVNVVVDPGFELSRPEALTWRTLAEPAEVVAAPQATGTGASEFDATIQRSGKRSLRVQGTQGDFGLGGNRFFADWTRPYEFRGWVKGDQATGKTYLQITWYAAATKIPRRYENYDVGHERGNGAARYGFIKSGTSRSEAVAGTFDWKQLTLRVTPPRGTVVAEFCLRSDDNSGTVWFDDLECDGYGALAAEAMVSNAGYPTKSYKHAVVVTKTPLTQLDFAIRTTAGAKQVFEGQLKDLGHKAMLNRHAYLAEFSTFQKPGEYVLEAKGPAGQTVQSLPFTIAEGRYLDIAKRAGFYYYWARCGMEVPGYHEACHTDDAFVGSEYFDCGQRQGAHKDLVGGWHDAGDFGKFHSRMIEPIYSLATAALLHPPAWTYPGEQMPALVSDAVWGADYLVKISRGNGLFFANLYGGVWGIIPIAEPSVETDGIPDTVDGLGRPAAGYLIGTFTTPALALAQAAIAVRPYDAKRAETYLKVARENYDSYAAFWKDAIEPATPAWKRLVMEPKALWAAATLYRATGDERFAKEAEEWLLRVLELLEQNTHRSGEFFFAEPPKQNNFPYAYLQGVMDYLETFPKSSHVGRAKAVVVKEIEERILPDTSFGNNPFGVHENLRSDTLWYYPEYNYTTEYFPKTAALLAWAADLFDRPDWRDAAERNFQWMIGNNHLQASYVAGIGQRQLPGWSGLLATPGLRHGVLPGAITKGICWGSGRVAPWTPGGRVALAYYGLPRGFGTAVIHDGKGFYSHGQALEIWEQFNGSLVLSAIRLQKARLPEMTTDTSPVKFPLGSPNLVENGGFEKAIASSIIRDKQRADWQIGSDEFADAWDLVGGQGGAAELVTDASGAHSGTRYLRVVKQDDQRTAAIMTGRSGKETFAVKPGEVYWLRVWMKGRGKVMTAVHEFGQSGDQYSRPLDERWLTGEWQPVDIEYTVPAQTTVLQDGGRLADFDRVRFSIHLAPQGELLIDDVMLRRAPEIELPNPMLLEHASN